MSELQKSKRNAILAHAETIGRLLKQEDLQAPMDALISLIREEHARSEKVSQLVQALANKI